MINWAEYLDALRSDPISKRQKFVKVVNVESNMLHGAFGDGFTPVACMCDAPLHFISIFWVLNKGNIGAFGKFSETVEAAFHSMHPVQGLRRAPEYFREKAELSFHVVSRYREVVDAVWVKGHSSRLRLGGYLMTAPSRRQSKAGVRWRVPVHWGWELMTALKIRVLSCQQQSCRVVPYPHSVELCGFAFVKSP